MEAFRQYTPMDPEAEGTQAALIMHFVNQAAPDIRKKLQKLERLAEKSIQDLITVAEKVYNTRETPKEKQAEVADHHTRKMVRILLAATVLTRKKGNASCVGWPLKVKAAPVRDQHWEKTNVPIVKKRDIGLENVPKRQRRGHKRPHPGRRRADRLGGTGFGAPPQTQGNPKSGGDPS